MKRMTGLVALCILAMGVSAQATEMTIYVAENTSVTYYYHLTDAVTWHGNYFGQDVKTFWKFDLSSLAVPPGSSIQINSAVFHLCGESSYPSSIPLPTQTMYQTSSVWPAGFTTTNAPAFGPALGTYTYPGGFTGTDIDCKDYLQSTLNSGETLMSFGSEGASTYVDSNDMRMFRMIGKDYTYYGLGYIPQLLIDYTVVPEPASLIMLALGGLTLIRRKK